MTNCPSEATLRLIGTEAVGEATFASLDRHVEHCPDCQQVLEAARVATPPAIRPVPAPETPPELPGLVIQRPLGWGGSKRWCTSPGDLRSNRQVAVKLLPKELAD